MVWAAVVNHNPDVQDQRFIPTLQAQDQATGFLGQLRKT